MPIDINGYNATFKAFTDFAAKSVDAGNSKAIARASADVQTGALAGRTVTASTTDSVRGLFRWFRSSDDKAANDATRAIFKDAIVSMFGGESKIPASVKDAMKMADYDCGMGITSDIGERYQLDVSEDGKTAILTMTIDKNINSQGGFNGFMQV